MRAVLFFVAAGGAFATCMDSLSPSLLSIPVGGDYSLSCAAADASFTSFAVWSAADNLKIIATDQCQDPFAKVTSAFSPPVQLIGGGMISKLNINVKSTFIPCLRIQCNNLLMVSFYAQLTCVHR